MKKKKGFHFLGVLLTIDGRFVLYKTCCKNTFQEEAKEKGHKVITLFFFCLDKFFIIVARVVVLQVRQSALDVPYDMHKNTFETEAVS